MAKGSIESRSKAQSKYDKANCVYVSLKLNRNTDADIIQKLQSIPDSRQLYIKKLIEADIRKKVGD